MSCVNQQLQFNYACKQLTMHCSDSVLGGHEKYRDYKAGMIDKIIGTQIAQAVPHKHGNALF